jgi:CDP-2,3-bis-(O-geranylgeranyl)-sn-glycerol synthase
MSDVAPALVALVLVVVANAAPVLLALCVGSATAWPVDGGRRWADGRPVLGPSKTWRGILAAVLATAAAGQWLLGDASLGALAAVLAMAGDLGSSFVKRRLGLRSGANALGLDQLPESLLPLLLLGGPLGLSAAASLAVLLAFFVLDVLGTRLLAAWRTGRGG